MSNDKAAAYLAEIDQRHQQDSADPSGCRWCCDAMWPCHPSRLIAAVRAGLAIADALGGDTKRLGAEATKRDHVHGSCSGDMDRSRSLLCRDYEQRLRQAITKALLGEDGTDES